MIPNLRRLLAEKADEIESQRQKAGGLVDRWERVIREIDRLAQFWGGVSVVDAAWRIKRNNAELRRQQMREVVDGLDVLLDWALSQGPDVAGLGVIPAVAWPIAAGVIAISGYGVVREVTDLWEIVSNNERLVQAYETQLGITTQLVQALETCTGAECEQVAQALVDVAEQDPADQRWPWWVYALAIGLPVLGGIALAVWWMSERR